MMKLKLGEYKYVHNVLHELNLGKYGGIYEIGEIESQSQLDQLQDKFSNQLFELIDKESETLFFGLMNVTTYKIVKKGDQQYIELLQNLSGNGSWCLIYGHVHKCPSCEQYKKLGEKEGPVEPGTTL